MAKRKWAIVFKQGRRRTYYRMMSGVGPAFGTKDQAIIFPTKFAAQYEIQNFPAVASVMCEPVKLEG